MTRSRPRKTSPNKPDTLQVTNNHTTYSETPASAGVFLFTDHADAVWVLNADAARLFHADAVLILMRMRLRFGMLMRLGVCCGMRMRCRFDAVMRMRLEFGCGPMMRSLICKGQCPIFSLLQYLQEFGRLGAPSIRGW